MITVIKELPEKEYEVSPDIRLSINHNTHTLFLKHSDDEYVVLSVHDAHILFDLLSRLFL